MVEWPTRVLLDPAVEDYFIRLESQPTFEGYHKKYGDQIARWYEGGKLVIIDNPPIELGEVFSRVIFPAQINALQGKVRFKGRQINRYDDPHLVEIFGKNIDLAKAFVREVQDKDPVLQGAVRALFPEYDFVQIDSFWKFTTSVADDVHFDRYGDEASRHHTVRLFWNIDSFPRVWMAGPKAKDILARDDIDSAFENINERNRFLNSRYLGIVEDRVKTGCIEYTSPCAEPFHLLLLASNSMMLVQTQEIAHACLMGRRLSGATGFAAQ